MTLVDPRALGGGAALSSWSLRDLAVEAFYNQRIILACLALGAAAGLVGLLLARPEYAAESQILARAAAEPAPREGLNGPAFPLAGDAVERIVQSDVQIIGSDPVLVSALSALNQPATTQGVERLRARLHTSTEPNSGLIKVRLKDADRARALKMLNAVLAAYARQRATLYLTGAAPRQVALITHCEAEIARLNAAIAQVRRDSGVLDVAQAIQLSSAAQEALDQRLGQARERQVADLGERSAAQGGIGRTPERILQGRDDTNATPNDDAHNTLLRLRQDRAHMASQYDAGWPGLAELDRKIAAAQTEITANDADTHHADHTGRNPVFDQLAARRAALDLDLAALSRQIGEIGREQTIARTRMALLQNVDAQLHDLERQRTVQEGIERQLAVSQAGSRLADAVVDDGNGALRIVQPPSAPFKGSSLGPTYLLAGLLAGAAAALAGACTASVLRQRYISPREAERRLGLSTLVETAAGGKEIGREAGAVAVAGLATLLADLRAEGGPVKVVQIVGAEAPDKCALALALGRASVRRGGRGPVLVVDFDSEDRYRRCAPAKAGRVIDLPSGRLEIAQTTTPGLWIATRTLSTPLGAPDASGEALRQLIELLRQSFGLVILVAPHAFADYPARRLYPMADANLLLIDSVETRAATAERMREVVLAAGGHLLGFVFTSRRHFIPEPILKWL